jgi:hypothetical protein
LIVVAHHDNSANNRANPDPSQEVAWGDLTSQEMVLPWFGVLVDNNADPEKILTVRQDGCSPTIGGLPFPLRVPGLQGIPVLPGLLGAPATPGLFGVPIPGIPVFPVPTPPAPGTGKQNGL